MKRYKKYLFIALILGMLGIGFAAGWRVKPIPPTLPPLPPEVIEVEVVKEIPVEVEVEGPVKIVERVVWRTKEVEVEVPVREEVIRVVQTAAALDTLFARAITNADKYAGEENGVVKYGWKGATQCQIRASADDPWTAVVNAPLSLSGSYAIQTPPVEKPRLAPWRAEFRAGFHSDSGVDLGVTGYGASRVGFYLGYQTADTDRVTTYSLVDNGEFIDSIETVSSYGGNRWYGGVSVAVGRGARR